MFTGRGLKRSYLKSESFESNNTTTTPSIIRCLQPVRVRERNQFNVPMLKQILRHFEIPFKSRDKKRDLIEQLMSFLPECDYRS